MSNLADLMGRAAVHTGQIVTWNQMMASDFQFCPNIRPAHRRQSAAHPPRRPGPLPGPRPRPVDGSVIREARPP